MLLPKVGQIIYIYTTNAQNEQEIEYRTRLADENKTELLLDIPVSVKTNKLSYIPVGKSIRIEFTLSTGVRYQYETTLLKYKKSEIDLIVVPKPIEENQLTHVQRRNFFRVETDVDIAILKTDLTRKVYRTEDIGGGGISFIAGPKDEFNVGEIIDCWILLNYRNGSIEHANFKAEVVRVKEEERGFKVVMLRYFDITESERQRIIRFSLAKQIELKEKSINN